MADAREPNEHGADADQRTDAILPQQANTVGRRKPNPQS
jgi:hypothetical protein